MLKDFKAFIMRGNVMDLAVGVIIGAAFGKIVSSLVNDLLMPLIGIISGGINLSGMKIQIGGTAAKPVMLPYGSFLQALIDFIIIALVIFFLVRAVNRFQKPTPATTKTCSYCSSAIPLSATRCPQCTSQL